MYNKYLYPAFLRSLIVSEHPVIIDHTILLIIRLVNTSRTRHEHLMIFSSYMLLPLDEVRNALVAEAKKDVQVTTRMIDIRYLMGGFRFWIMSSSMDFRRKNSH